MLSMFFQNVFESRLYEEQERNKKVNTSGVMLSFQEITRVKSNGKNRLRKADKKRGLEVFIID